MKLLSKLSEDRYKEVVDYFKVNKIDEDSLNKFDDYLADLGFFFDKDSFIAQWSYYYSDSKDYVSIYYIWGRHGTKKSYSYKWKVKCFFNNKLRIEYFSSIKKVINFLEGN